MRELHQVDQAPIASLTCLRSGGQQVDEQPEPRLRRRVLTCDGGLRPPQWPWSAAPIVSEREVGGRVAVRAAPATSGRADGEFLTAPAFVYGTASGRTPHTPRTCAHFELQHIPV